MEEFVNREEATPQYYTPGTYEVFKVASAWGFWRDAALFNVLKYISRAGKKPGISIKGDLEKALAYLKVRIAQCDETDL